MKTLLINAKFKGDIKLNDETLTHLKKFKTIALYTSVQFLDQIETVVKQLEDQDIKVISSIPARAEKKYQLLGCDCNYSNLNLSEDVDAFLYIGDGLFHPQALVIAQRDKEYKEVIRFDPIGNQLTILDVKDVEKALNRYKGSRVKFLTSNMIGVLISTKPGQEQYKESLKLKEKYPDKTFYYFIENNIDFNQLENFPFIECWVNTACPRIGFETKMMNLSDL